MKGRKIINVSTVGAVGATGIATSVFNAGTITECAVSIYGCVEALIPSNKKSVRPF